VQQMPRLHNWWEFTPKNSTPKQEALFQLHALGFGLLQDGFGSGTCGNPIRRSRSAKRGSERMLVQQDDVG
jgi:hypothetical protein